MIRILSAAAVSFHRESFNDLFSMVAMVILCGNYESLFDSNDVLLPDLLKIQVICWSSIIYSLSFQKRKTRVKSALSKRVNVRASYNALGI